MELDGLVLVIDVAVADPVRRSVGPVAWFVLESLAVHAAPGTRQLEVTAGTRQIAAAVSLSKDAVARAMRRLAAAGVVERVDNRESLSGRFGSTVYVVELTVAGLTVAHPVRRAASPSRPAPPKRSSPRTPCLTPADDRQLSLLD